MPAAARSMRSPVSLWDRPGPARSNPARRGRTRPRHRQGRPAGGRRNIRRTATRRLCLTLVVICCKLCGLNLAQCFLPQAIILSGQISHIFGSVHALDRCMLQRDAHLILYNAVPSLGAHLAETTVRCTPASRGRPRSGRQRLKLIHQRIQRSRAGAPVGGLGQGLQPRKVP